MYALILVINVLFPGKNFIPKKRKGKAGAAFCQIKLGSGIKDESIKFCF